MELENLTTQIPESEPKLRVYPNYAVLNASAVRLLDVKHGDYIQFASPRIEKINGKPLLYVRKTNRIMGCVSARQRGKTMILGSRKLAKVLRETLGGTGTFRVCPEDTVADVNGTYYNVFFRNYGN